MASVCTLGGVLFIGGIFMATKEFKTIEEQMDLLVSRGLSIPDRKKAAEFLYENNYYRVSGYSLTLRKHDRFYPSVSVQNIIDIYEFDYHFRHILLKYLDNIEVRVKSIYAYEFTKRYPPTGYLDAALFSDQHKHSAILSKAEQLKQRRRPHEAYLKHFLDDRKEDIPLWAYVDVLTISDVSMLYAISPGDVKTAVAQAVGLTASGEKLMEHFMHRMTIIRNLCAHSSRLYNRLFEQKPRLSKKERGQLRRKPDGSEDNEHLYGFLLIMKRLLKPNDFSKMKREIIQLGKTYPFVHMKYYGFPDDWMETL